MSKNNHIIVIILTIGLLIRLAFLAVNYQNKNFVFDYSLKSASIALSIAINGKFGYSDPTNLRLLSVAMDTQKKLIDPADIKLQPQINDNLVPDYANEIGLGIIMGIVWSIVRDFRFIYVQILQLILDIICIFLVYLTVNNIFNNKEISIISSILYTLFPIQIYLITFPAPYAWVAFGVVMTLYILSEIYSKKDNHINQYRKITYFTLIGLISGIITYIRSTILFLPIFVIIGLFFKEKIKNALIYGALILIVEFTFLTPLIVRNYKAFNKIMLTRGVFWHSVWTGWGAHKNPWGIVYEDGAVEKSVLEEKPGITSNGPEYESILKRRCLHAIKENPFWFPQIYIKRILMLLFPASWTKDGHPYFSYKKTIFTLPLFILTFYGLYIIISKKYLDRDNLLLFSSPTLYFFITTIIIHPPQIKYVYPAYIFMLIISSFSIKHIYSYLKNNIVHN